MFIVRDKNGTMVAKISKETKDYIISNVDYSLFCSNSLTIKEDCKITSLCGNVSLFLWKGYKVYTK